MHLLVHPVSLQYRIGSVVIVRPKEFVRCHLRGPESQCGWGPFMSHGCLMDVSFLFANFRVRFVCHVQGGWAPRNGRPWGAGARRRKGAPAHVHRARQRPALVVGGAGRRGGPRGRGGRGRGQREQEDRKQRARVERTRNKGGNMGQEQSAVRGSRESGSSEEEANQPTNETSGTATRGTNMSPTWHPSADVRQLSSGPWP